MGVFFFLMNMEWEGWGEMTKGMKRKSEYGWVYTGLECGGIDPSGGGSHPSPTSQHTSHKPLTPFNPSTKATLPTCFPSPSIFTPAASSLLPPGRTTEACISFPSSSRPSSLFFSPPFSPGRDPAFAPSSFSNSPYHSLDFSPSENFPSTSSPAVVFFLEPFFRLSFFLRFEKFKGCKFLINSFLDFLIYFHSRFHFFFFLQ